MKNSRLTNIIVGLAATGGAVIGVISGFAALFPLFNGDFLAAGVLFVAASLSFGMLAIAVFGK